MTEVFRSKTECIKNFIEKNRTFIHNIEIKREFLGKLRKEFVVEACKAEENIKNLFNSKPTEKQRNILSNLDKNWKKIDKVCFESRAEI